MRRLPSGAIKCLPLLTSVLAGVFLVAGVRLALVSASASLPEPDPAPNPPGVRFVITNGLDTNDCSSPANACRTVQRAIDVAAEDDTIKVATGVYTDDDTPNVGYVVALTKTVILRGGYDAAFADPPDPDTNPTILDARRLGRVISITGDISPTVEGFIITAGNASGLGGGLVDGIPADVGGGIYIRNAIPIITNNVVTDNVASTLTNTIGLGGGIGLQGVSVSAVVSGNQVFSNIASTGFKGRGGGLYLGESAATVSSNTVCSNIGSTANHGGGGGGLWVSEGAATIRDNLLQGNIGSTGAEGVGGGVAVFASDHTVVSGNTVLFNISSTAGYGKGGGLGFKQSSNLLISDNHVQGNICSTALWGRGGGIFLKYIQDAKVSGNTVFLNSASTAGEGRGGGLYLAWDSSITLSDNRVQRNTASTVDVGSGGGLFLWFNDATTLTNNIITDNQVNTTGSGLYIQGCSPRLLHTTVARNTGGDGSGVYVTGDESESYSNVALTNTILVSHTVGISVTVGNTATLEATLWGSGNWANDTDWDGAGNVTTGMVNVWGAPAFMDPDAEDYHIRAGSAAIDLGVHAGVATDIDGETRPDGCFIDIGADEFASGVECKRIHLPLVMRHF